MLTEPLLSCLRRPPGGGYAVLHYFAALEDKNASKSAGVSISASGAPSQSRLEWQLPDSTAQTVDMPENTLVVFEGSRVRHRVTSTGPGDLRVILSMTYCDDPHTGYLKELVRRVKDTAFFGIRAIWD